MYGKIFAGGGKMSEEKRMYANIYTNGSLEAEGTRGTREEIEALAKEMKQRDPKDEICVWMTDDETFNAYPTWDEMPEEKIETFFAE